MCHKGDTYSTAAAAPRQILDESALLVEPSERVKAQVVSMLEHAMSPQPGPAGRRHERSWSPGVSAFHGTSARALPSAPPPGVRSWLLSAERRGSSIVFADSTEHI